ncbi:MAG: hypothetical protein GF379_00340 [Candidatus Omnitrophica bacterium]|nr:hypothetical protein [Candidatus Omnitrophota bacterium]
MKDTILNQNKTNQWERARLAFFPHAFNYILKEEVAERLNCIDMDKICFIKSKIKNKSNQLDFRAVAEKLMEGE